MKFYLKKIEENGYDKMKNMRQIADKTEQMNLNNMFAQAFTMTGKGGDKND